MPGNLLLLCIAWTVACYTHAHGWELTNDLAGLLAQHLTAPAASLARSSDTWQHQFSIQRELQGAGFHRTLVISIQSIGKPSINLLGCQASLLQPLPSSIYADPYQLQDLVRSSSSRLTIDSRDAAGSPYTFQLLGPLDLELPAPACKANALLLTMQQQQQQQLQMQLSVPLHAKYPEPRAFGFQGWQSLSSGHVHVVVPQPWLLLDCRQAGGQLQVLRPPPEQQQHQTQTHAAGHEEQQQQQQHEVLLWSVPAGNLDHRQLVSWGTLLVAAACCAVLSVRALQVMAAV